MVRLERPSHVPAGHEMVTPIRTVVREARVPPDGAFAYGGRTPTPGDKHRQTPPTHSAASTARLTPWTPDSGDALARTTRREAPFIGSATHLTDGGPLDGSTPLRPRSRSSRGTGRRSRRHHRRSGVVRAHHDVPARRPAAGPVRARTSRPRRTSPSTCPSAPSRGHRRDPADHRLPQHEDDVRLGAARAPARPPPASRTPSSSSRAANRAASP